ncbi:CBS domain-containing protein [Streptomyces sp. H10-C2]|uniref:CBS domain-containing protein n=1 Tax=unclassified Streptomyces TaxID=2593676 RepID=UPI0024BB5EAA|nr:MULTISPECIES: CBS domain-containing protein [unclassified Streptomyces]MDJ0340064.1 CBS domain-containing protein [Streptomyces sp. PH10-H1]MDJ0369299.1 CBS domain-containing protein [Streptomyces sp. H10-C2]
MATAREIMHKGVESISEHETLDVAAKRMRDAGIGALAITDTDGKLRGVLTDRDIVLRCVATGHDPAAVRAADLLNGKPVTAMADDDAGSVVAAMADKRIRRIPVLDGGSLVGMISEADIARKLGAAEAGALAAAIRAD